MEITAACSCCNTTIIHVRNCTRKYVLFPLKLLIPLNKAQHLVLQIGDLNLLPSNHISLPSPDTRRAVDGVDVRAWSLKEVAGALSVCCLRVRTSVCDKPR